MLAQQTATNGCFGFTHTAVGAKQGTLNTFKVLIY